MKKEIAENRTITFNIVNRANIEQKAILLGSFLDKNKDPDLLDVFVCESSHDNLKKELFYFNSIRIRKIIVRCSERARFDKKIKILKKESNGTTHHRIFNLNGEYEDDFNIVLTHEIYLEVNVPENSAMTITLRDD